MAGSKYFLVVESDSRYFSSCYDSSSEWHGIVIFAGSPIPFQNGKFNAKSIDVRRLFSTEILEDFDLLKLESIKESGSRSSRKSVLLFLSPKSLSLLKEVCFDCLDGFGETFLMGLKMNTLTKLDVSLLQGHRTYHALRGLFEHHRKSLITIGVRTSPRQDKGIISASRFGDSPSHQRKEYDVPLIFRLLKLEDFPKLKLLIYNGGNLHIERGGAKPSYYYLPY